MHEPCSVGPSPPLRQGLCCRHGPAQALTGAVPDLPSCPHLQGSCWLARVVRCILPFTFIFLDPFYFILI